MNGESRFYNLSLFWVILLSLLAFFIGFIISISTNNFDIQFGIILGLPSPVIAVLISRPINNLIISIGKEQPTKGKVMTSAIFLYILKYLIVVLPIIVGMAINLGLNTIVFNPIGLVIIVFVYVLTTMIVQFYFISYKKHLEKGATT